MNKDLKIIKKKYGERMMKLCRELFPTLLEKEGLLSRLLLEHFEPTRFLYEDIISNELVIDFKGYIYSLVNIEEILEDEEKDNYKTPKELLEEAGYDLYECHTEEEIQSFRKYYRENEKLCTFRGNRLERCYVFFAVKKDVDNIKREDFQKPKREDLYGTSVISIQFTKDKNHTLSIKNRYNHKVNNPDATFKNNLDNIILGLTESFSRYYGMTQAKLTNDFEIPGYVEASDEKYYKYSHEINNIYYCPNNIIIDNFRVKRLKQNKLLIDYFILDLENKTISLYDYCLEDYFEESLKKINQIQITKEKEYKKIIIKTSEGDVILKIDKGNKIIEYQNNNIKEIGDNFFCYNIFLEHLWLPNVTKIGHCVLYSNESLEHLWLPKVQEIGSSFLCHNKSLNYLSLPEIRKVGCNFLFSNESLNQLSLPNLIEIDTNFLYHNESLEHIWLPKVQEIGDSFLCYTKSLNQLLLPQVQKIGDKFLDENQFLECLALPNVTKIGNYFLYQNKSLEHLWLPKVQEIGEYFLYSNQSLNHLSLPKVQKIGFDFLHSNKFLNHLELPNVTKISHGFLYQNNSLEQLELPNVIEIDNAFLYYNKSLNHLELPNVVEIGDGFLAHNTSLTKLILPKVTEIGESFLYYNTSLTQLELPSVKGRS